MLVLPVEVDLHDDGAVRLRQLADGLLHLPRGDGPFDLVNDGLGDWNETPVPDLLAMVGAGQVHQQVPFDRVQPGSERALGGVEPVTRAPRPGERLLHGVLGQVGAPEGPPGQSRQLGAIGHECPVEPLLVGRGGSRVRGDRIGLLVVRGRPTRRAHAGVDVGGLVATIAGTGGGISSRSHRRSVVAVDGGTVVGGAVAGITAYHVPSNPSPVASPDRVSPE